MDTNSRVTMKEILSPGCAPERRFITLNEAGVLVEQIRSAGYSVGVVGGVWDLLHIGHANYLRLAKGECDVLVVVVDSDELVKDRKGPTRPVVPQEERIQMVCHLASVQIVILRDLEPHTADKEYINKALSPDVCVLSTTTGDIPQAQHDVIAQFAKRVAVFPPQAETSSSARIRLLAIDGATPLAKAVTALINGKARQVAELLADIPQQLHVVIEGHMSTLKER